jgi:hypothetical protein
VCPLLCSHRTIVQQRTEPPSERDATTILDCSVDLTACRRLAVVQCLIDVKAAGTEGCVFLQ